MPLGGRLRIMAAVVPKNQKMRKEKQHGIENKKS